MIVDTNVLSAAEELSMAHTVELYLCGRSHFIAYYSLAAEAVEHADAPQRIEKGLART